ncbi:hypothetical protein CEXT_392411 [Caerostris extrusa]|uniref:Uncharacterized protein n=1 Tax=Caerostris extrusa TaxID=172846 RepID=A0AAV4MW82_CAEEX|nr:hypothetical protein CEXT_392411 [Caerostris extrusa]
MVTLLGSSIDLKQGAAEAIASVADFHKAWKAVRQAAGIPLLVDKDLCFSDSFCSKGAFLQKDQKPYARRLKQLSSVPKERNPIASFGKVGFIDKLYEIIQTSAFHTDSALLWLSVSVPYGSAENENNLKAHPSFKCRAVDDPITTTSRKSAGILIACLSCCMTNPQIRQLLEK